MPEAAVVPIVRESVSMQPQQYLHRVVNRMDPSRNVLLNMTAEEAEALVGSGQADAAGKIEGQFAICSQRGRLVYLARSIGRPMRYFLAKKSEGPCLYVAESMKEIFQDLQEDGLANQFHPSYTRMVPAHYLVRLELIGCPDPNPKYDRFFTPERNIHPLNIDVIGRLYIERLLHTLDRWLDTIPRSAPIGVLFSGGIDSGAVLLGLHHQILRRGESPSRLKAFTLRVDGDGRDATQAGRFLDQLGLGMLWEPMDVASDQIDWRSAVHAIEDYKPLDVQSAAMGFALCAAIRKQYPDWKYLIDGDGGDENMKDYPIEENPELTIRSVVNNLMLYQEGWGVHAIKHSLVYSGGQSRGHVRSWVPEVAHGFRGFSPFAMPTMIEVAEGIPFADLAQGDVRKLYRIKGEVIGSGIEQVLGIRMPIFEKCRFQHGAVGEQATRQLFPADEMEYRKEFLDAWKK